MGGPRRAPIPLTDKPVSDQLNALFQGMGCTAPDAKHLPDGYTNLSWIILVRSNVLEQVTSIIVIRAYQKWGYTSTL